MLLSARDPSFDRVRALPLPPSPRSPSTSRAATPHPVRPVPRLPGRSPAPAPTGFEWVEPTAPRTAPLPNDDPRRRHFTRFNASPRPHAVPKPAPTPVAARGLTTPKSLRRVSSVPALASPVTPTPAARPSLLPRKASSSRLTIKVVEPKRLDELPVAVAESEDVVESPPPSFRALAPVSYFSPDSIYVADPFDAVEPITLPPSQLRNEQSLAALEGHTSPTRPLLSRTSTPRAAAYRDVGVQTRPLSIRTLLELVHVESREDDVEDVQTPALSSSASTASSSSPSPSVRRRCIRS